MYGAALDELRTKQISQHITAMSSFPLHLADHLVALATQLRLLLDEAVVDLRPIQ